MQKQHNQGRRGLTLSKVPATSGRTYRPTRELSRVVVVWCVWWWQWCAGEFACTVCCLG